MPIDIVVNDPRYKQPENNAGVTNVLKPVYVYTDCFPLSKVDVSLLNPILLPRDRRLISLQAPSTRSGYVIRADLTLNNEEVLVSPLDGESKDRTQRKIPQEHLATTSLEFLFEQVIEKESIRRWFLGRAVYTAPAKVYKPSEIMTQTQWLDIHNFQNKR